MPSVTVKQEKIRHYLVAMEIKNTKGDSYYDVGLYPEHDDGMYGYPINNNVYHITEKKQATATYNRYKRKAKAWSGEV